VGYDDVDNSTPIDLGLTQVTVGIEALEDLERFLTDELNYNMTPKSQEIIMDHKTGRSAPSAAPRAAGGAVPIAGAGTAARPGITGRGGFVAPPGGMIAGRAPEAGRGASVPSARAARYPDDEDAFVVPRGAPGVLSAPDDPDDHRPGPGVIGIDR
jgi:hypothetical protein